MRCALYQTLQNSEALVREQVGRMSTPELVISIRDQSVSKETSADLYSHHPSGKTEGSQGHSDSWTQQATIAQLFRKMYFVLKIKT